MPGTHSVGSLFVNISGSTKGLKKALGNAKKQIGNFQGSAANIFGGGRVASARADMARAGQRRAALESYGARGPSPVKGSREQFAKEMKRVLEEQGRARTELTAATAARNMRMGLAVFGVTVGAVSMMLKKGINSGRESIARHMQFGAIGPEGPRVIAAQVRTMMSQIAHAQSTEGSEMLAKEAERAERWEEVGRKWEKLADRFGDILLAIAEFFAPSNDGRTYERSQRSMQERAMTGGRFGGPG